MDNGFPAQVGMLKMSVRKRAEQDCIGPLCSSANLVKASLGQQAHICMLDIRTRLKEIDRDASHSFLLMGNFNYFFHMIGSSEDHAKVCS